MTVHHARVLALTAILVGISALAPGARPHAQETTDELRALAQQGDVVAQLILAGNYNFGQGVPQDYVEAVLWFRLAADQGYALAQLNLGTSYANGQGVPQDHVEAHMWFNLAAAQSSGEDRDQTVESRDAVAERMTPDQIAEAQRRAREWTPTPER